MRNKILNYMKKLIFSFIFLVLFSNFLFGQDINSVSLEEDLIIGNENSEDLLQWAGVCSDKEGNIYVTDMMDYSIKKFNKFGKLVLKKGRKGRGPGEFLAIRLIAIYDSLLFVTDQYIPGIQVFDTQLNYKTNINFSRPILDFQPISSNLLLLNPLSKENSGKLITIDRQKGIKAAIPFSDDTQSMMMENVKFKYVNNNCIYIAYMWQDLIKKIDINSNILWSKSLFKGIKSKTKKIKKFSMPTEIIYKDIDCDTLGYVYILGGDIAKKKEPRYLCLGCKW